MNYMHEMGIEWFCGNEWKRKGGMGRRRAPARRIERIVVTDEWALAGNHRVGSLSNEKMILDVGIGEKRKETRFLI